MKDKKEFGAYIAEKRRERGLTQAELAAELYVTVTAVSKWERGVTYPDITLISDLCRLLGVTEHELIEEGNDMELRRLKTEARRYRRISDAWFYALVIGYAVALVVCFICNLAVDRKLSWFFIVLAALLVAFSLFPSPSRFFKRGKVLAVTLIFFVSLLLLLATCCIYVRGDWFFKAAVPCLFAFCAIMLPVYLGIYPVPEKLRRHAPLVCVSVDFVLLIALVICETFGNLTYMKNGVVLSIYFGAYIYLSLIFICYVRVHPLIRAGLATLALTVGAVTADPITTVVVENRYTDLFRVNLGDWGVEYLNGNILTVVLIAGVLVAAGLIAAGIALSKKGRGND